jgi:hypothetical protein
MVKQTFLSLYVVVIFMIDFLLRLCHEPVTIPMIVFSYIRSSLEQG